MKKKLYNLYYGTLRLNNNVLQEDDINRIFEANMPIRKTFNGKTMDIPLSKVRVVKCTIV